MDPDADVEIISLLDGFYLEPRIASGATHDQHLG